MMMSDVDLQTWHKEAFEFRVIISSVAFTQHYTTADIDSSFRPSKETLPYSSQALRLSGQIERVGMPEVGQSVIPDLSGLTLEIDVHETKLTRSPDGLFHYGCIWFYEDSGDPKFNSGFINLSPDQHQALIRNLPVYLSAFTVGTSFWMLSLQALLSAKESGTRPGRSDLRFFVKHLTFRLTSSP